MDIVKHLLTTYPFKITTTHIELHASRWKEFPLFLKEMGVKKMVEVGTYKGQYAETLCSLIPGLDLTCVDAWKVYKGYKDFGVNDLESDAYQVAVERATRMGFKLLKAWSLDAVNEFADESLDAIFIDGNHDFRHVTEDVDEWSRKVKKGGIVSGHDFFENYHKGFGVREAIPAWCAANRISPLFVWTKDKCPTWHYIKP